VDIELANSFRAIDNQIEAIGRGVRETKASVIGLHRQRESGGRNQTRQTIVRAQVCRLVAAVERGSPEAILSRLYRDNERVGQFLRAPGQFLSRAATPIAATSIPEWAGALVGTMTISAIASIAPQSTYSALARRGLTVDFPQGIGIVRLPRRTGIGDLAGGFVAENDPIPVAKTMLSALSMRPHKMGIISTFTKEVSRYSVPQIEAVLGAGMADDTALAVDAALLDSQPASASRPAGLLNGVTPLTATIGGGQEALIGDIAKVSEAIPSANQITYLMSASMRDRALLLSPGASALDVIVAPALAEGTLVALDASDLAIAEAEPDFSITEEAALVSEDSEPISDFATAATTSLYQQDIIGLRMLTDVAWQLRRANRVAQIAAVTW
jgi:hypothetical protein